MFKKVKENKKGFTLAELLIVVAIIAVLVAISIPIFTTQLEKSREGVDLANIRSCYAEATLAVLNGAGTNETSSITGGAITCTKDSTNNYVSTVTIADFSVEQHTANWVIDATDVAGVNCSGLNITNAKTYTLTFNFDANGKCTSITAA